MLIPEHKIDEIRDATDIVEVVSDYVALKKRGSNFFGLCPFHNEKTASFSVHPQRNIYKCFGCGKGGNVFNFLMEMERIGFVEAVRLLGERAGIELPESNRSEEASTETEAIYHALRLAGRFFHDRLMDHTAGAEARTYLTDRGYEPEAIRRWGLGYAPDSWDELMKHAAENHVSDDILEKAGLIVVKDGGRKYDRFRNRLMFPLITHVGQVVGFTGRVLEADAKQAKYVNSPETAVYHKGRMLYGLNLTRNEIRRSEEAYLVEGNTDAISLYEAGVMNVVATSGTALTPAQVKLIGRYTDTVVLLYDADEAGLTAARRSIDLLLEADFRIRVLQLPDGRDPDGFVRHEGREAFLSFAESKRLNIVTFLLQSSGFDAGEDDPDAVVDAVRPVLDAVSKIPDAIRRESYLRVASEESGLPYETLRIELKKRIGRSRRGSASRRRSQSSPSHETPEAPPEALSIPAERQLLRLMITHGRPMVGFVLSHMGLEEFSPGSPRKTAGRLLEMFTEDSFNSDEFISEAAEEDVRSLVAGLLINRDEASRNWSKMHSIDVPQLDANARRAAEDAMKYVKLERVNEAIKTQQAKIERAQHQSEDITPLLLESKSLLTLRSAIARKAFLEWQDDVTENEPAGDAESDD